MNRSRIILLGLWLLLLGGCAASGSVLGPSLNSLRMAVATTKSEAAKRIGEINSAARSDTVELLLLQTQRPSEAAFAPIIAVDTSARWAAVFEGIDAYLGALENLVDDGRTRATGTDLTAIADTLQSPSFGLKLPPGTSGLFGNLAASLLQASAERKAETIMQRTDPAFQKLIRGLADLVVDSTEKKPGTLRAIIDDHWFNVLTGIENEFNKVAGQPVEVRRPLFDRYGAAIDQRQSQRQQLADLRSALLAIGEAHAAAARGSGGGTRFWLQQINAYLATARAARAGGMQ